MIKENVSVLGNFYFNVANLLLFIGEIVGGVRGDLK